MIDASWVIWASAIAGPSVAGGTSEGIDAERAAANGGVARPARRARASIAPTGRPGTSRTKKTVARTTSEAIITARRPKRSPKVARIWPGPSHGTREAAVTRAMTVAEPVRSRTRTL